MANNLKKFATAADYSAATLNYPAVSWIVSGDTVNYDLSASTPTVNDKLIYTEVYTGNSASIDVYLPYSNEHQVQIISSLTVNGVSVEVPTDASSAYTVNNPSVITIEVGIVGNELDLSSNNLNSMGTLNYSDDKEYLIPAQITSLGGNNLPNPTFVMEATTPPSLFSSSSAFEFSAVYVPDSAVNAYKNDTTGDEGKWSEYAEKTYPISEYQGNLPV